ncbi:MAG: hypothetical protein CUN55_20005, partial [Phototrophicales bacterium]
MRWKIGITLGVLFSTVSTTSYATTLQEALVLAYQKNPTLIAARKHFRATAEAYPKAMAGFLPTVQVDIAQTRTDYQYRGNAKQHLEGVTRALTVTQPLFEGGNTLAEIKQAK